MPSPSTTLRGWDDRYRRVARRRRHTKPATESIGVSDLTVGDHLMWGGTTFTVKGFREDGPLVQVQARNGNWGVHLDYLAIEQVDVASPRPMRKGTA
jgi:hypothetical protein